MFFVSFPLFWQLLLAQNWVGRCPRCQELRFRRPLDLALVKKAYDGRYGQAPVGEAESRRTNTAPRRDEADGQAPIPRGEAKSRRANTTPRREEADELAPTPRGEAESRRTSTTPRREEAGTSPRREARLNSITHKCEGPG